MEINNEHDYFNFTLAEEEFGFDFISFSKDGFTNFLRESFIKEFKALFIQSKLSYKIKIQLANNLLI